MSKPTTPAKRPCSGALPALYCVATSPPSGFLFALEGGFVAPFRRDTFYFDPNTVVARTYAVMMTDNAVDAAGNRMADDYSWSFRTQRRISQTLLPAPATGSDYWALTQAQDPLTRICPAAGADFGLGEINAPGSGLFGRIFIAIRVTELPTGILQFLTANLSANRTSVVQAYGDSNLGVIHASHVSLPLTTNPYPTLQGVSALRDLGIFSSSPALGVKNLDVAVALAEDYAQRSQRANTSQYVLAFDKYSDDGSTTPDAVRFDCSSVQLDVTYMIP